MKKEFKGFLVFVVVVSLFLAVGCTSLEEVEETKDDLDRVSRDEMLYRSEEELDSFVTRGDENVVDWRLAQEFAYLELEEMQMEGDFSKEAELRELPIVVYDHDGDMRYYEFRVIDDSNKPIGAITAVADKTRGYPIAYTLLFPNDYNDGLEKLLDKGKITEDNLLSLVDNDYPDYAIGVMETTRNGLQLGETYDSETGEEKSQDELSEPVNIKEFVEKHPEYEEDLSEQLEEAEDFEEELSELWQEAESRQGEIRDLANRSVIDSGKIDDYSDVERKSYNRRKGWLMSKACGTVATNFTLGYMAYKDKNFDYNPGGDNTRDLLEEELEPTYAGNNQYAVVPWNIAQTIPLFAPGYSVYSSNLRVTTNGEVVLETGGLGVFESIKKSINDDGIPGISLVGFSLSGWLELISGSFPESGVPHYRNVVGYRITEHGWWRFTWTRERMLIHDQNVRDHGNWETYNSFYHWEYLRITED